MSAEPTRPDPDALLASIRRTETRAGRGKLKIFFGMCPGVGKTYAMLQAARQRQSEGVEVLVGVVETHGRKETEALLDGLTIVPRAAIEYRGTTLEELDLDAVLIWHPALAVVDELAHSNAPGSRHPKRFRDVLELLDAGIDVFTTLNVQHLESRRDVVQNITGVAVRETVPDSVLDQANELMLIDLTPEQLRTRLAGGKVYPGERAGAAAEHFFRESNLMALREMSLRVVAEHVDRDLRDVMREKQIAGPWKTGDRLLVAVSASPFSEKLIRYTRRLAGTMEASWIAVNIEAPRPLGADEQARLSRQLALARQLGAEVISTPGAEVAEAILRIARQHNVTQIVLGKPVAHGWLSRLRFRRSPLDDVIRRSGDIDLHMVRRDDPGGSRNAEVRAAPAGSPGVQYLTALAIVGAVTGLGLALREPIGYWAVALIYMLAVVLAATRLGRGPILFLAAASALLWNFLFIPPRFTILIYRPQDVIMFGLYFVVAAVAGHLTARLREREQAERAAEERSTALYRLTRALATSASAHEAVRVVVEQIAGTLNARCAVLLPKPAGLLPEEAGTLPLSPKEESVAAWSFQRRQPAGRFTETLPNSDALHLPLVAGGHCEGVLAISLNTPPLLRQRELLEAFAGQLAAFLEKDRAVQAVRKAQLEAQSQKLQKALFDSVSHELKTPLATISGALEQPQPDHREIIHAVRRLTRTVDHLLDATRLESGLLKPVTEWCDPGELAREAVAAAEKGNHEVRMAVAPSLPMLCVDTGLLEQALGTLVHNAALYSAAGEPIEVEVSRDGGALLFAVKDHGAGLAPGEEEAIFEKFHRGRSAAPGGLGLGLAIARQLVELHGGSLRAHNREREGGAVFIMRLPLGEPMRLPEEAIA